MTDTELPSFYTEMPDKLREQIDMLTPAERDEFLQTVRGWEKIDTEMNKIFSYGATVTVLSKTLEGLKDIKSYLSSVDQNPKNEASLALKIFIIEAFSQMEFQQLLFEPLDTFQRMGYPIVENMEHMAINFSDIGIPIVLRRTEEANILYGPFETKDTFWEEIVTQLNENRHADTLVFSESISVNLRDIDAFRVNRIKDIPNIFDMSLLQQPDMTDVLEQYKTILSGIKLTPYFPEI